MDLHGAGQEQYPLFHCAAQKKKICISSKLYQELFLRNTVGFALSQVHSVCTSQLGVIMSLRMLYGSQNFLYIYLIFVYHASLQSHLSTDLLDCEEPNTLDNSSHTL